MAVMSEIKPQHMQALDRANVVRLARAEVKRAIIDGSRTVAETVLEPPDEVETMTVADLLMAQHRWGRTRVRRFLGPLGMPETKMVGNLTPRQRDQFVAKLTGQDYDDPYARMLTESIPEPRPTKMQRKCGFCGAEPGKSCTLVRRNGTSFTITDLPTAHPHAER